LRVPVESMHILRPPFGIFDATTAFKLNGCVRWGSVTLAKAYARIGHAQCNEPGATR
jgi:hypothetical protein